MINKYYMFTPVHKGAAAALRNTPPPPPPHTHTHTTALTIFQMVLYDPGVSDQKNFYTQAHRSIIDVQQIRLERRNEMVN